MNFAPVHLTPIAFFFLLGYNKLINTYPHHPRGTPFRTFPYHASKQEVAEAFFIFHRKACVCAATAGFSAGKAAATPGSPSHIKIIKAAQKEVKMSRFTLPRDIYHGKGCLAELKNLKGKKAILVVGGGSMKRQGFLDKAVEYLKEGGMEVSLFEGVEPDPSVETVMKGAQAMRDFEPDWIVAMGGGSPIDAAKAMWAFYEYPDTTFEDLCIPFNFPELRQKAKFAAIPSTSGTATEVTAFSVITDYAAGIKYPLADFNITPDVAIVDPELVEALPPKQVAYTGMDALTHAIEAYVSTLHCAFTDPLALQAIEMVFDYLPASYNGNMTAREEMHYAQCLAGMAFSNALLGIVHSMAHKTGAAFSTGHITHGCANAMYLPFVIKYNAKEPAAAYKNSFPIPKKKGA